MCIFVFDTWSLTTAISIGWELDCPGHKNKDNRNTWVFLLMPISVELTTLKFEKLWFNVTNFQKSTQNMQKLHYLLTYILFHKTLLVTVSAFEPICFN